MKKNLLYSTLALSAFAGTLLTTSCKSTSGLNTGKNNKSIVILYDNDVHCGIDGYSKMAGYRDAVRDTADVFLVSNGDYLQGGTTGAISKGQYIVDVMKHVKYDAITLGNHEFDYGMERMFELLAQANTTVVSSNLVEIKTGKHVFNPYIIKTVGKKKVAFVGVTTPTTLATEAYSFFDAKGNQHYDLLPKTVFQAVQNAVNDARKAGADYVIVLSHVGEDATEIGVDSHRLIESTNGIDIVLDGHTHSVIPTETVNNKDGKPVLITQTGTKFNNIGKLVIAPNGKMSTSLVPINDIKNVNAEVQAAIDSVSALSAELVNRHICKSEVDLRILDEKGDQQVRFAETNAGDIVTDAYRIMTGADIALTNGGGIRTEVKAGDLTYGDIVSLLPYDNYVCVLEVKGSKIVELLKANTSILPLEDGQFPQASGIKYTAVVADHSIKDVQILNTTTNEYEPIDLDKNYTLATIDYCITGGGMRSILKDQKVVKESVMLYNDALIQYVTEKLNGHIGQEYAKPQGRITVIK